MLNHPVIGRPTDVPRLSLDPVKEFIEYPKWIHRAGQPSVVVHTREEEDTLLGVEQPVPETFTVGEVLTDAQREELRAAEEATKQAEAKVAAVEEAIADKAPEPQVTGKPWERNNQQKGRR